MKRPTYERPAITGRQEFETRAVGCAKVPGLGDMNFCGAVWSNRNGVGGGCTMNPTSVSRSS
ncbi:MAG TPA: hypothetical protein VLA05_09845 [Coriobacteriia bacterium]|nr:hypothetical protein [Coriobacteriia bacterium]